MQHTDGESSGRHAPQELCVWGTDICNQLHQQLDSFLSFSLRISFREKLVGREVLRGVSELQEPEMIA